MKKCLLYEKCLVLINCQVKKRYPSTPEVEIYISYPLLTYPASSTFAVSRSFLKIQFLFPKSQLNAVTCSCHCKRVWVATVVHTKHWPAFLVWTWALLAQKKKLLQQFHMNRASELPVSLISVTVWHKNLLNRKYEQNLCLWEFFFLFIYLQRETKKIALEFLCLTLEMWEK